MNLTALTLLGLATGAGQPAADVTPMKTRSITLAIDYDPARRKDIDKVVLFYSRGDSVWHLAKSVLPNEDAFKFDAPEDGVYWFNLMNVYRDGRRDPPDPGAVAPAAKFLLDATAPVVRVTNARRDGDDVLVQWEVDERFPDDKAVRVTFKTDGIVSDGWQPVPAENVRGRAARFKPGTAGAVTVQVTATDLAGHQGSATRDVPAGTSYVSAAVSPAGGTPPPAPAMTFNPEPAPAGGPVAPAAPVLPPPNLPVEAVAPPAASAPVAAPIPTPVAASAPVPPPAPTFTGAPNWSPAGAAPADPGMTPIAASSGPTAPPPADAPGGVQLLRSPRFDIQYQVENGPSGLSRVDLYVTRDDGRTWHLWSRHAGQELPLHVVLDTDYNRQTVEGPYGFRLVPVSGAGLADGAPAPGAPPELRVLVDLTPPEVAIYPPEADPAQRNVLVLRWKAVDANFGRDPIAIEWSEQPTGPWLPVTGGGGVAQAMAGQGAARVANSQRYPWALPAGLGTHKVYLKFTAWDAAGNRTELTTPNPVLVDLTKPRARIQGIAGGFSARP
jgi:hypothetical protein